jgi:hypothetical protein
VKNLPQEGQQEEENSNILSHKEKKQIKRELLEFSKKLKGKEKA